MSSTEEGALKRDVKEMLRVFDIASEVAPVYRPKGYYNMPVPSGYGVPMLDFVGHYRGRFFMIETKAPGKEPTARQTNLMELLRRSGAWCCWADNFSDLERKFVGFTLAVDMERERLKSAP